MQTKNNYNQMPEVTPTPIKASKSNYKLQNYKTST